MKKTSGAEFQNSRIKREEKSNKCKMKKKKKSL